MNLKIRNGFEVEPEMRVEEDEYKECPVCHQEFTGVCPMVCADCPFSARDELDHDEEEKEPDFDDVDRLDKLLVEDKESERLVAEASENPPEELKDD